MTDLLSALVKKGSEVDLVKPLKNLILSLYSTSDRPADFSSAVSELSRTQSQALSKNLDKSLPAIELLYRYYDQISALETKIPAHEVQIPFKWKDAFDKRSLFGGKVSLTVASLGYEKVYVLFKIAAMQNQIGSLGRISDTDEELKSAAKLFQSASGICTHLKSAASVMGGQEPTPDLNPVTLTALAALMLAQAQEMFVTKAIQDKIKDATVAKLCVQTDDMFADSLRLLQKDTFKHLWDKEWIPTIAEKQAAYSALAHYFQSQVNGINKQVGDQISRLNHCIENVKVAQQWSGIPSFFSDYVSQANRLLTEAKKDYDFIYHERIPEASNLLIIDKVASARLARPIAASERLSTNFKDLFDELVPVAVHEAMASCDVRRTDMTNSQIGQLREATQLLNSILASLNLPRALEDAQTSADVIPPPLIEKSRAICEAGGASSLQRSINEMPELVQLLKDVTRTAFTQPAVPPPRPPPTPSPALLRPFVSLLVFGIFPTPVVTPPKYKLLVTPQGNPEVVLVTEVRMGAVGSKNENNFHTKGELKVYDEIEEADESSIGEKDASDIEEKDGSVNEKKDGSGNEESDDSSNEKNDENNDEEEDGSGNEESDDSSNEENDRNNDEEEDGSGNEENDDSSNEENDENNDEEEDGSGNEDNDDSSNEKNDGNNDEEEDGSGNEENDDSSNEENDGNNDEEEDGSGNEENDDSSNEENDGNNDEEEDTIRREYAKYSGRGRGTWRGRGARGGAAACDPLTKAMYLKARSPKNNDNLCVFCTTPFRKGGFVNNHIRYSCSDLPKTNVENFKSTRVFKKKDVRSLDSKGVAPRALAAFLRKMPKEKSVLIAPNGYMSFSLQKNTLQCTRTDIYKGRKINKEFEKTVLHRLNKGTVKTIAFPSYFWSPERNFKNVFKGVQNKNHCSLLLLTVHSRDHVTAEYFESVVQLGLFEEKIRSRRVKSKLNRLFFPAKVTFLKKTNRYQNAVNKGCVALVAFWMFFVVRELQPPQPRSYWLIKGLKEKLQDMLRIGKSRKRSK